LPDLPFPTRGAGDSCGSSAPLGKKATAIFYVFCAQGRRAAERSASLFNWNDFARLDERAMPSGPLRTGRGQTPLRGTRAVISPKRTGLAREIDYGTVSRANFRLDTAGVVKHARFCRMTIAGPEGRGWPAVDGSCESFDDETNRARRSIEEESGKHRW